MAQEQIDTKAGFFVQDDEEVCDDNSPQSMRLSAYAFFVQSAREEHMKKNPNDKLIFCEFSKQCVEKWNKMSKEEKDIYNKMAIEDKQRY